MTTTMNLALRSSLAVLASGAVGTSGSDADNGVGSGAWDLGSDDKDMDLALGSSSMAMSASGVPRLRWR
uniref:Secreted protein n=2 Tax=Oryza TaxID=4527 RepID=Q6ZFB5_ORYSJ|nr:hypothetical protein [Oryza sativa Japonica Group]